MFLNGEPKWMWVCAWCIIMTQFDHICSLCILLLLLLLFVDTIIKDNEKKRERERERERERGRKIPALYNASCPNYNQFEIEIIKWLSEQMNHFNELKLYTLKWLGPSAVYIIYIY